MDTLITFAVESIEQNIKNWDEDDVKSEILDYYGDETLEGLMEGILMGYPSVYLVRLKPATQK